MTKRVSPALNSYHNPIFLLFASTSRRSSSCCLTGLSQCLSFLPAPNFFRTIKKQKTSCKKGKSALTLKFSAAAAVTASWRTDMPAAGRGPGILWTCSTGYVSVQKDILTLRHLKAVRANITRCRRLPPHWLQFRLHHGNSNYRNKKTNAQRH